MFSVVKMMKEQGNQFDWSQIAIDIPSLPCFDQKKMEEFEKAVENGGETNVKLESLLMEGYSVVSYTYSGGQAGFHLVVKVTGDNPSVELGEDDSLTFNDCEPVTFDGPTNVTPIRALAGTFSSSGVRVRSFVEGFGFVRASLGYEVIVFDSDGDTFYIGAYWEEQLS